MSDLKPHEHVAKALGAYKQAHETIRQHAATLKAERQARLDAGAKESAAVDAAVAAGVIGAGTTLNPDAAP